MDQRLARLRRRLDQDPSDAEARRGLAQELAKLGELESAYDLVAPELDDETADPLSLEIGQELARRQRAARRLLEGRLSLFDLSKKFGLRRGSLPVCVADCFGDGGHLEEPVFQALGALTAIEWLDIDDACFDGASLRHLKSLRRLSSLSITRTWLPEFADLARLGPHRGLASLDLSHARFNGDDLSALASFPELERLDLSGTVVTDEGLTWLTDLPKLRGLKLSDCLNISGEGIPPLPRLESLNLMSSPFSDRDLAALPVFPELQVLTLYDTQTTIDGWVHLTRQPALRKLAVGPYMTDLDELRRLLPRCEIY